MGEKGQLEMRKLPTRSLFLLMMIDFYLKVSPGRGV